MDAFPILNLPELYTDAQGIARWREGPIALNEGSAMARLSKLSQGTGHQFRQSPVGFRSAVHCTVTPQWLFVLSGMMCIGLLDGSERFFQAGQGFFSNDVLPLGEVFDPARHGHWSAQMGDQPLTTVFIRHSSAA